MNAKANGDMTAVSVSHTNENTYISGLLEKQETLNILCLRQRYQQFFLSEHTFCNSSPKLSVLISEESDHPGAGSYTIDNFLPERFLHFLEYLWLSLPTSECGESTKKKLENSIICSVRSYICDSEGFLCQSLSTHASNAFESSAVTSGQSSSLSFFPQMRFLNYDQKGGELGPHIDLTKVDSLSGKRSTHTFILYLRDCSEGGETALLKELSPHGPHDFHQILSQVAPRRGRLLLFPHACPHQGNKVISTPKILLRGEAHLV